MVASIRAYGAKRTSQIKLQSRLEDYIRCARMYHNLNCWIGIRSNILGGLFSSSIGAYFVYGPVGTSTKASDVGFALAMAGTYTLVPRSDQFAYTCIVVGFSGLIL